MEMTEIEPVARLKMVSGSVVSDAEISDILASYGYIEDSMAPNRYDHQVEEGCAIELSTDFETVDIFGDEKDHLNNINYMLQRFGWIDCELLSINGKVDHVLMARLVNVNITSNRIVSDLTGEVLPDRALTEASAGAAHVEDEHVIEYRPQTPREGTPAASPALSLSAAPASVAAPEEEAIEALQRDFARIQELTVELENVRETNDRLEDTNASLQRQLTEVERRLASQPTSGATDACAPGEDVALRGFVEKHILALANLDDKLDTALVSDLRSIGYAVQVKLVRV